MKWLIENWTFFVVVAAIIFLGIMYSKRFAAMPSDKQVDKVKEWLLYAVIEAERHFGSGTGALKLRSVYDDFLKVFPDLAFAISFELFSQLVDEALEQMRNILEVNKDIEAYVKDE